VGAQAKRKATAAKKALKKPAAAGPAQKVLKRQAAAAAAAAAAVEEINTDTEVVPEKPALDGAVLKECIIFCQDKLYKHTRLAVLTRSPERGQVYFLLKTPEKDGITQTSRNVFGSELVAHKAALVLKALYEFGVSNHDLVVVKNSGKLFGVICNAKHRVS